MKLVLCSNCQCFRTIGYTPGCGMCPCGHTYFRVLSTKAIINEVTKKKDIQVIKVMVSGPCTVWYISDKEIRGSSEGDIIRMQWMHEPHSNVQRVNKGTILFYDQPDRLKKYIE